MSDDLREQVDSLEEWIESVSNTSREFAVSHVGWLTANQTILAAMLSYLMRNSDEPDVVRDQIKFDALSLVKNRTNFLSVGSETANEYGNAAESKVTEFFRGFEESR